MTRAGSWARCALAAATAAGVAQAVSRWARTESFPGGARRWERTNHAGEPVTLAEGLALAAGSAAPLAVLDPPGALAVLGAAGAGAVDDLAGDHGAKGLRGHLRALRRGQVTTGAVKILLLGATGLGAAAWSDRAAGRGPSPSTLVAGALVAGSANLANLLDLRPGRALKAGLACALPLTLSGSAPAASVTGAGLAALPDDLRGRSMLGDTGANPLGAAVGLAAAQVLGTRGRLATLAVVTALNLASERVSFSAVIERHELLRRVDAWGRPA